MNFTHKISVLVTLQILLIIASSLIIVYFESQTSLAGNVVNVAGKNRLLVAQVQIELDHVLFHADGDSDPSNVLDAIQKLEENILFLKNGGTSLGIKIEPVPPMFADDWNRIWEKFTQYEESIHGIAVLQNDTVFDDKDIDAVRQIGDELVMHSDVLASGLGNNVEKHSADLVLLQLALGAVNVLVHVFMIIFILGIFKNHAKEMIKTERFTTIGEFASMVAHDLRNPLGAIRNSQIIIAGRNNGRNQMIDSECSRIDRCINRMAHQIEGVMNYARDVPLFMGSGSIREIMHKTLDTVKIPENIDVKFPENDASITCDLVKIEFVFTNLLLNAIQAIGGNQGSITIRLADGPAETVLKFENSGPAIPERDLGRIFEPLFTTKMQGTGLGLVSCKSIIKRHGGSITVQNDPVTFTVIIPRRTLDAA